MDDARLVRGVDRVCDLDGELQSLFDGNRTRLQLLGKRLAGNELQNQVVHRLEGLEPVNGGDVGVVERREKPGFARETGTPVFPRPSGGRTLIATSRPSFVSRAR